MKGGTKFLLLCLLAVLIYSFSVNALQATAGLQGDVNGFWTMDDQENNGGCADQLIRNTGVTQDEAYVNETGGFTCIGLGGMLFNFDNMTSHLDSLEGVGEYTINNIELYSCASGSNSGSDGDLKFWWNLTGYEIAASLTYGDTQRFSGTTDTQNYNFANDVLVSGSVRKYDLSENNNAIMNLRIGGVNGGTTVGESRKYLNTTACTLVGDVGNKSAIYLNYTYSLTNIWNLTSPTADKEYQSNDIIQISGENTSTLTEDYNISFSIDGADFVSIANLTQVPFNFTFGLASTLGTGFHNISVHQNSSSASEIDNLNFTVGSVVDFCDALSNVAFNITFADEENDTEIGNASFGITLFTDSETNNISKEGFGQSITICTTAGNTGFGANVILEYNNATGSFYQKRTYFNFLNYTGTQQNITTYLLEASLGTLIDVTLQDENALPLIKHYVQVHRFSAGTNTFRIVDSALSDENGLAPFFIDLNEVLYKFVIIGFNGNLVDTTITREVTGSFTIQVIGSVEKTNEILNQLQNSLSFSLDFVNATKIITLTWNDITTGLTTRQCLQVTNRSLSGLGNVSEQCVGLPSSTLTYNYTDDVSSDLVATFEATATADGNEYQVFNIVIINVTDFINYRGNEHIFAILIIGTMAGLGAMIGATGVLILTVLGVFITFMLGLLAISSASLWGLIIVVIIVLIMGGRDR